MPSFWYIGSMRETWQPSPRHPNYEISSFGSVRHRVHKRIRKPHIDSRGYPKLTLRDYGNTPKTIAVHRLVALTFLSNDGNLTDVDHIDGDKTNNRLDNLRWVSHKQNCSWRKPMVHGEVMTRATLANIIDLHRDGLSVEEIYLWITNR